MNSWDRFYSTQKFARTVCSIRCWVETAFAVRAERLSDVAIWGRTAGGCVMKAVDWMGRNANIVILRDRVHLIVGTQLRFVCQAVMVRSGMAELTIAPIATLFAEAAAKMATQPRGWHLGICATDEATRVNDVPDENCQPHRSRLQDVQETLIAWKSVASVETAGEFNKAVNDTNSDGQQASVKSVDHPSPATLLIISQASEPFCLKLISVECDDQAQEHDDKALLHANTTHVDVQALLLRLRRCSWTGHSTTNKLGNEGYDIKGDKDQSEDGRREQPDLAGGRVEVDHTGENHVSEGVDP